MKPYQAMKPPPRCMRPGPAAAARLHAPYILSVENERFFVPIWPDNHHCSRGLACSRPVPCHRTSSCWPDVPASPPTLSTSPATRAPCGPGRAARLVSPPFTLTLWMNETTHASTASARVAATYSGVALGGARVEWSRGTARRGAGLRTSRPWHG